MEGGVRGIEGKAREREATPSAWPEVFPPSKQSPAAQEEPPETAGDGLGVSLYK